ncbi:uncharacterized protein LOC114758129 [Neltuma alba]|uniref:uncharacterized protein LOC114758129 n=1 Tax=Neltuma alba TaxID=207710 RepID=UPI0010A4CC4C|nr:uncharacterized protein LOC114758129 [Prosopis alba]
MILSDEKGDRIEASIAHKGHIQRYVKDLVEGGVYQFENFEVVDNDDDNYKTCDHPCKIMFHAMTFFQEHDLPIPLYAFNFVPIKDIANNNAKNNKLVDIIGFLQAFGNLVDHKNDFGTTKKLALTIADQNEIQVNVSLFGEVAKKAFEARTDDLEVPTIVVIRFAKIARKKSYGHISNAFYVTRVYFNPDFPEVRSFIDSLNVMPGASQAFSQISSTVVPEITSDSLLTFPTRIPLGEISILTEASEVVTKVTIQKVETSYGWYYDGCPCDKKPAYEGDKLKCNSCHREVLMTEPKFKLHYTVFDSTAKCSILFFNRHASELIHCSAVDLRKAVVKSSPLESSASGSCEKMTSNDRSVENDDINTSQLMTSTTNLTKW